MMKKKFVFGYLLIILLVSGLTLWWCYDYLQNIGNNTISLNESTQVLELKRGTSMTHFARQLERDFSVENAHLIPYFVKINPSLNAIKSGVYQVSDKMTVRQLLELVVSGKEIQYEVKFVEGKTAKEWIDVLENAENLSYDLKGLTLDEIAKKLELETPIEGWLYPDTYYYTANTTDFSILKRAHQKMKYALQVVWDNRAENLPYKTPYELLIMASIIEKETGLDSERKQIASVFINRLKFNMRLQTDPTIIYGMGDEYKGQLKRNDLRNKDNPYNTYVIFGLPPTPITMPSMASLEAAAHPDTTNYLYFVADGSGGHTFSTNYKAHSKAVDNYWRTLKQQSH